MQLLFAFGHIAICTKKNLRKTPQKILQFFSIMATFPRITSLEFNLHHYNNQIVQNTVYPPKCGFQFTADFDYYVPNSFDFKFLDAPDNNFAVMRSALAGALWETLKMKGRYILAAAYDWNPDKATDPLPITLAPEKLEELDMIPPPFPTIYQLSYNFFEFPAPMKTILEWVEAWQERSRRLSAWICKAKIKTAQLPDCSWKWPVSPLSSYSFPDNLDYEDDSEGSVGSHASDSAGPFTESPSFSPRVASSFKIKTESLKRFRSPSPFDATRDGNSSNKKQLVFYKPTLEQLLERDKSLITGEVESYDHTTCHRSLSTNSLFSASFSESSSKISSSD